MRFWTRSLAVLAVVGFSLAGQAREARAVVVTYSTMGVFASSGTNVYTDPQNPNVRITFTGIPSGPAADVPPAAQVNFGFLENTSLAAATTIEGVADTFTLTITQTTPSGGSTSFVGTLGGTLRFLNSQAFIDFETGIKTIGLVTYRIIEADEGVAGRATVASSGRSTVEGEVNLVPEPGTMAMACIALPVLVGAWVRRRRQV